MDLHLSGAQPTALERETIDTAFARAVPSPLATNGDRPMRSHHAGHDARARRHLLLPVLHAVSDAVGWISPGALDHIAVTLSVPPA
ncbi:MAG TPA: NADH-quinone oxidoreductase subunit E, partial [Actinomycetospora sp.]|nr:NADH-quinone oxidoreductase subunit E [Actinomycetospora sp.]